MTTPPEPCPTCHLPMCQPSHLLHQVAGERAADGYIPCGYDPAEHATAGPCVRQDGHDGTHVGVDLCPVCRKPWDRHAAEGRDWRCPAGTLVAEQWALYNPAGLVQFA